MHSETEGAEENPFAKKMRELREKGKSSIPADVKAMLRPGGGHLYTKTE